MIAITTKARDWHSFNHTDVQPTHLVAGDLVQRTRPSVGIYIVLLRHSSRVVLLPLGWDGVGELD